MMTSSFNTIRASCALLLLVAVGCGGRDGAAPSAPAAEPSPAATAPTSPYGVFAADADTLVHVSVSSLVSSPLWLQYGERMLRAVEANTVLDDLDSACGVDPLAAIESITFGGHAAERGEAVAIIYGPSRSLVEGCLERVVEEQDGAREDGTLARYAFAGETFWLGWLDEQSAVVGFADTVDPDALARRLQGEPGLAHDAEVVSLLESRVDAGAAVRVALLPLPGSELERQIAQAGLEIGAIYGSVNATEVLDLDLGLELPSDEYAAQTRDELAGMLPLLSAGQEALAAIVGKLELAARGAHLVASVSLTDDDLQALVQAAMGGAPQPPSP
jgi:hypothetical protein